MPLMQDLASLALHDMRMDTPVLEVLGCSLPPNLQTLKLQCSIYRVRLCMHQLPKVYLFMYFPTTTTLHSAVRA